MRVSQEEPALMLNRNGTRHNWVAATNMSKPCKEQILSAWTLNLSQQVDCNQPTPVPPMNLMTDNKLQGWVEQEKTLILPT